MKEAEAMPAIARRTLRPSRPLKSEHKHATVPVTVPLTAPYTMKDPGMRTVEGKASEFARYYEPKSHISPRVKWELARLKKLAKQRTAQMIVLPNRGVKPTRLAAVDSVFRLSPLEPSGGSLGNDYWELERFYVELAPGDGGAPIGVSAVPEPGTGSMLCLGLTWMAVQRRTRRLRARARNGATRL